MVQATVQYIKTSRKQKKSGHITKLCDQCRMCNENECCVAVCHLCSRVLAAKKKVDARKIDARPSRTLSHLRSHRVRGPLGRRWSNESFMIASTSQRLTTFIAVFKTGLTSRLCGCVVRASSSKLPRTDKRSAITSFSRGVGRESAIFDIGLCTRAALQDSKLGTRCLRDLSALQANRICTRTSVRSVKGRRDRET